jgi:hypothetical protein
MEGKSDEMVNNDKMRESSLGMQHLFGFALLGEAIREAFLTGGRFIPFLREIVLRKLYDFIKGTPTNPFPCHIFQGIL